MVVKITLDLNSGQDLGPFNLTANVGSVSPGTATRAQLLQGLNVTVDSTATQVTVTSTGDCTNATTVNITGIPVSETYYELEPCQGGALAYTLIEPVLTDQRYVLPGTPDIFYTPTGESLTQSTAPSGFNSNIQPVVGETGCPPQPVTLNWTHTAFQNDNGGSSELTIIYQDDPTVDLLGGSGKIDTPAAGPYGRSGTILIEAGRSIQILLSNLMYIGSQFKPTALLNVVDTQGTLLSDQALGDPGQTTITTVDVPPGGLQTGGTVTVDALTDGATGNGNQ